jgi:hypothetical protein
VKRFIAVALLLAAIALGCTPDEGPGLELDFGGICHAIAFTALDEQILGDAVVLDLAADGVDDGAWALIDPGDADLYLQRLPAPGPRLELKIPREDAGAVDLFAGASAGEAWITYASGDQFRAARLFDQQIVDIANFDAFPGDSGAWERRLIFSGRRPLLLASPTASTDSTVRFYLGRLDPDLQLAQTWELSFPSDCYTDGISDCVPVSYPRWHILDVAEADGESSALLLIEFERAFQDIDTRTTGVTTLEIVLGPDDVPAASKREHIDLLWSHRSAGLRVEPGQIARDAAGYYVLVGATVEDETDLVLSDITDYRLLRHNQRVGTYGLLARPAKYTNSHLIQLPDQVALGQIFATNWYAARLVDLEIDREPVAQAKVPEGSQPIRAGNQQLLLRAQEGPDARALIGCAEQ